MARRARDAGAAFETVRLTQSFRTAAPVLAAVDKVFADPLNRKGVAFDDEVPTHHTARGQAPGLVEIWPAYVAEAQPESRDWLQPLDHEPANSPANRLARRIAAQIGAWLGDTIAHKGGSKRLSPGDFIVLVRKRSGFVAAMAKALRDEKIAVAGADRLVITDHIAVKDLMALGRTVANFEDDLSLAEVLKSPLFDFSDDELMALALSREDWEPLSLGLRRLAGPEGLVRLPEFVPDETAAAFLAKARAALARLDTLRDRAGFETIFAFYARILGPEGGRRQLTARLGSDSGEVIDAFLDLALSEEEAGMPGLDAFLSRLASAPPVLKREMDQGRGAVRIMTTHAAKGLEAPVVFLVDPGSAPFVHAHGARLMEWPAMPGLRPGQAPGFVWRAAKELENGIVAALKETEKELAEEEYRRLLYVGMTRAADRLVICGTAGTRGPNEAAWLPRVQAALEADCRPAEDSDGAVIAWRYGDDGPAAGTISQAGPSVQPDAAPPRPLDLAPLPPEILPPRPLSPSSAGAATEIEPVEMAGTIDAGFVSPVLGAGETPSLAIRRGLIVHRLLQVLPELAAGEREAAAERFVAASADDMSPGEQARLVASALAVLEAPDFGPIFAPGSRAEVSVVGEIRLAGRAFRVNGTIDRLAVTPEAVLIVDYKTNRPPPATLAEVAPAYVLQLALYREILKPLYPDRPILAALLFTEAPRLIPLDEATMEAAIARRSATPVAADGGHAVVAAGSTERQPNASIA